VTNEERALLTTAEVASYLGISQGAVQRAIERGTLAAVRVNPRLNMVTLESVEAYRHKHLGRGAWTSRRNRSSGGATYERRHFTADGPTWRDAVDRSATERRTPVARTHITAIANQKGGTAKTTTTLTLGAAMADRGQRVLLIDLDPQASLTAALNVSVGNRSTVYTAMLHYLEENEPQPLADTLAQVSPTLHLLPASIDLAAAEMELVTAVRREYILGEVLALVLADYDVVLIDCPPSLGLLVVNALTIAQDVVIPLVPEYLAAHGLRLLLNSIERIRKAKLNPHLTVAGILFTMVDNRTTHGREVQAEIRASIGRQIPVLGEIKRSIKIAEAAAAGVPVTLYEPRNEGAYAYGEVADTLLGAWGLTSMPPQEVVHG
jgi:chromosome partitioning protein